MREGQRTRGRKGGGRIFQQPYYSKDGQRKLTRTFFVEYYHRGRRFTEKTGSTNPAVARRKLNARLGAIATDAFVDPVVHRTTVAELKAGLLADYTINRRKSRATVEAAWKALDPFFGGETQARDVTTARLRQYVAARQALGRANATIKNELAAFRRAFSLALDDQRVVAIPKFPMPEVHNARQGFFEEPEYRAVLAALPPDLRPLVICMYHTGWRTGELVSLEWSQVDFAAGMLRLEPGTTKSGRGREFPFTALPELAEMLRAQWASTPGARPGRGPNPPARLPSAGRAHPVIRARLIDGRHPGGAGRPAPP